MRFFGVISIIVLSGCASSFFDRDQGNPLYHSGGSTVVAPVLPTNRTYIGKEFQPSNSTISQRKTLSPEEAAIGGVLATGITLAINKDYYRSSYLSGRCKCVAKNEPGFEIPCGTVNVVLTDLLGNEISRITTEDGEFVFPVEKNREYRVHAFSMSHEGHFKPLASLRMGDSIVLELSPKVSRVGE